MIAAEANAMLRHLLPVMRLVSVAAFRPGDHPAPIDDPNDVLVWGTAVVAGAVYLVSHNTGHFPPLVRAQMPIAGHPQAVERHIHDGIEFLTAIEFIGDVLGEDATLLCGRPLPAGGGVRSRRSATPR